jgi:hypothetical protein
MPIIHAEGLFGTSLLNPSRRVPGFMREGEGGKQITTHYPNFIAPCPRIHKHLNFSFTVSALLKIFVRSRRDQEKKMPDRDPTVVDFQNPNIADSSKLPALSPYF